MATVQESTLFDIDFLEDSFSPTHLNDHYSEIEKFCTPDSLEASSNYINILLTSYGYSVPLIFDSTEAEDKCKIVNCIYALLNDRKKDQQEREDYVQVINQMKKERQDLENQLIQSKRECHIKEKHLAEITSKSEANEVTHKKHQMEYTRMKEEISKVKHNMQYMKTQYAHETKRHEQDLAKTQDRLVKLMNSHYKVNIATINMNTHFATTTNNASDEDQVVQIRNMYTALLAESSTKEQATRKEAEEFRSGLIKLYTGVRQLLENQIQRFDQVKVKTMRDAYEETARFRLPMDCGGIEAMRQIDDLLVRLKEEWDHQIKEQAQEYTEQDMLEKQEYIEALEQSVEELLDTIEQTRAGHEEETRIYKRFEQGGFFDTLYPTPKDAYIPPSDSEDSVDENSTNYRQLRKKAMRDQRKITESALELGKQRAQLEAERWAFTEMKRELQMQEILNDSNHAPSQRSASRPAPQTLQRNPSESDRARKRLRSFLGAPSGN